MTARPLLSDVSDIVRPFVGKRQRGDRTGAIDILHILGNSVRADVRDVSSVGITVHFDGRLELIAWPDIYEITTSALDDRGNRISTRVHDLQPTNTRKAA